VHSPVTAVCIVQSQQCTVEPLTVDPWKQGHSRITTCTKDMSWDPRISPFYTVCTFILRGFLCAVVGGWEPSAELCTRDNYQTLAQGSTWPPAKAEVQNFLKVRICGSFQPMNNRAHAVVLVHFEPQKRTTSLQRTNQFNLHCPYCALYLEVAWYSPAIVTHD
jgi:hypothetical protein